MTGNFPVGGPVPPPYGPFYPPPPKPSRAGVWLGSIACVLATAALVVGVIALVTAQREPSATPQPEQPQRAADELLIPEIDKVLCKEIGPLIREQTDRVNGFLDAGAPGTSERKAAIPKFKADTVDWYRRIQPKINRHTEPPRYLARTTQGFVDGMLLYSENLHDDRPADPFDDDAYNSAIVYAGGPLSACYKLGAGW